MATYAAPISAAVVVVVLLLALVSDAQVPAANTFRFVNEGEFGPFVTEYDASYRATPLFGAPFQLMWYNTTPGRFYVGLRMGLARSESLFRWVWEANRGRAVGEKATLTFGTDGNLVLAEASGEVIWSTGTANEGVVGIKILTVGNIVLYNNMGRFVWQSFDHPTDTLMVGQSLYVGGPTRIVSRRSETDNSDGIYSFVLEPVGLNLYVTPIASKSKPLLYSSNRYAVSGTTSLTNATFDISPPGSEKADAYELTLSTDAGATFTVTRPKYNATLSILRLQVDGNLVAYTYYDPVDYQAWERTYAFFSDDGGDLPGCSLPSKCGALGVCEAEMCVACPSAGKGKGLVGWSRSCAPPKACMTGSSYHKVVGVEQFIPRLNKAVGGGKLTAEECKRRCSGECGCLGVFYWEESSSCWLAPVLGSLTRLSNSSSHVVYIKTDNHY